MKFRLIDKSYFDRLGVDTSDARKAVLDAVYAASIAAINRKDPSRLETAYEEIPAALSLLPHGNSTVCPKNILEITPVTGCHLNCRYCLVCAQQTMQTKVSVYKNYGRWLRVQFAKNRVKENRAMGNFYYLSPKTEAFSPFMVEHGIIQDILTAYAEHVHAEEKRMGQCLDTMLIVTKGGIQELIGGKGKNILEILKEVPNNVQVNVSITPLGNNPELRRALEPNARSVEDRLAMVAKLRQEGILAEGALTEPLFFPFAYDEAFYRRLKEAGIRRVALDFLTSTYENLAVVFQIIGWYEPAAEKELWEAYLVTDVPPKSGGRITMPVQMQRHHYARVIDAIKKAGIEAVTYCMFAEKNIRMGRSDYGKSGCMAHVIPHPAMIQRSRIVMAQGL